MEIAAFVISIVALVFSIPSMILSIIHICKEKLNIDFKLDGDIFGDDAVFLRKKEKFISVLLRFYSQTKPTKIIPYIKLLC